MRLSAQRRKGEEGRYRPPVRRHRLRPLAGLALASITLAGCSDSGAPPATMDVPATQARAPQGEVLTDLVVERVVDGDTLRVDIDGRSTPVRLIGLDTPETVKPDSPVECFGPEASDFATRLLTGQPVVLEFDDSQGRVDTYDRVLAYVWRVLPDGSLRLANEEIVAGGYGRERQYGPTPYAWREALTAAQDAALEQQRGLWGACTP